MAANADQETLKSIWTSRFENGSMRCDPLQEAVDFGIVDHFTPLEVQKLTNNDTEFQLRWLMLSDHYEAIAQDPSLQQAAKEMLFDGGVRICDQLALRLRFVDFSKVCCDRNSSLICSPSRNTPWLLPLCLTTGILFDRILSISDGCEKILRVWTIRSLHFAQFVSEIMGKNISEWQQSLEPWSKLVDRGFDEVAGSQLLLEIATVATASTAKPDAGAWDKDGFAATKKVVRRLFFARHKGDDVNWWRERLADITIETTCPCLTVLLSWGTPDLITALKDDVDPIIEKLSSHDWSRLLYMASLISLGHA